MNFVLHVILYTLEDLAFILAFTAWFARRRYSGDYLAAVGTGLLAITAPFERVPSWLYLLAVVFLALYTYMYHKHYTWYKEFERETLDTFKKENISFEDFIARGLIRSQQEDNYVVLLPDKRGDKTEYHLFATTETKGEAGDIQQILYTAFGREHKTIVKHMRFYRDYLVENEEDE